MNPQPSKNGKRHVWTRRHIAMLGTISDAALLANCKTQGLDPETYLTEVIKRLPHNATPAQAAELTPARLAATLRAQAVEVA